MNLEELIKKITGNERYNYKCFDLLKQLLKENSNFKNIIEEGIKENKIFGFTDDIWIKIYNQNIRQIDNFESFFKNGYNIGNCTFSAIQLSYSLDYPYICGGTLNILKGTKSSDDGRHTWILNNNYIIDTSLMLIIHKNYYLKLGYQEENRRNPNNDPRYNVAKDFATDENLKKKNPSK